MAVEIMPCSLEQIELLIRNTDTFYKTYGFLVIEEYLPFEGALEYTLQAMQTRQIWHPWLPYLFVFRPDSALVGFGGFKSIPDSTGTVEIGYAIAPSYQNQGLATSAANQLIQIAFASDLVDCVCAHTLAKPNASTRVLTKCGMTKISEIVDSEDGNIWRWEISKNG